MPVYATPLLIALALASLSGCGQTGPLYMPPEAATPTEPDASGERVEQSSPVN